MSLLELFFMISIIVITFPLTPLFDSLTLITLCLFCQPPLIALINLVKFIQILLYFAFRKAYLQYFETITFNSREDIAIKLNLRDFLHFPFPIIDQPV